MCENSVRYAHAIRPAETKTMLIIFV